MCFSYSSKWLFFIRTFLCEWQKFLHNLFYFFVYFFFWSVTSANTQLMNHAEIKIHLDCTDATLDLCFNSIDQLNSISACRSNMTFLTDCQYCGKSCLKISLSVIIPSTAVSAWLLKKTKNVEKFFSQITEVFLNLLFGNIPVYPPKGLSGPRQKLSFNTNCIMEARSICCDRCDPPTAGDETK